MFGSLKSLTQKSQSRFAACTVVFGAEVNQACISYNVFCDKCQQMSTNGLLWARPPCLQTTHGKIEKKSTEAAAAWAPSPPTSGLLYQLCRCRVKSHSCIKPTGGGGGAVFGLLKTALGKKKSEHQEKITDDLKWFHAWIKSSYRAGAASPLWRTSLCPPAGSYQSFYSSPPQLCPRRWSCSPFFLSSLWNNFLVSDRVFSSSLGWRETPSDDPRGAVSWSFPAGETRREKGGERRWHRRLVCHTVEPESGARLSQLQSTHCCLSMWF